MWLEAHRVNHFRLEENTKLIMTSVICSRRLYAQYEKYSLKLLYLRM